MSPLPPTSLQQEEEMSFALVFVPEDPSDLSVELASQGSPSKGVPLTSRCKSTTLSSLHSSCGSLLLPDNLSTFDKLEMKQNVQPVALAKTREAAAPADKKKNLTRTNSRGLRRSRSSGNFLTRNLSTGRLKSRNILGREKSQRLSRHRSTSCIQETMNGGMSEEVVSGRTKSPASFGSSDPPTVALHQVDHGDDSKKPPTLSRKSSKRNLTTTDSATTAHHMENLTSKSKPRRKSTRNLVELKPTVEKTAADSENHTSELSTHGVDIAPKGDGERIKRLTKKSSRRALKETPNTPTAFSPIPSNPKPTVDRRSTIRRTMSEMVLAPGEKDGQAEKNPKGVDTPKIKALKRFQFMKRAVSLRINSRKQKNRIETTELSPFEHHLTCDLWSDDASVVSMALMKLSSLSTNERETSLSTLEQVGSGSIIGSLRKWWYDSDVQLQGFRLLSLLANGISDRFIEGAARCGAFEVIMDSMESSPSDQLLQEYACGAIFTLVNTKCSHTSEKFISDLGALPIILRPLLTFPANNEIQNKVRLVFNSVKRFDHLRDFLELGEPILRKPKHKRRSLSSHHQRSQKTEERQNHPQHQEPNTDKGGFQVVTVSTT